MWLKAFLMVFVPKCMLQKPPILSPDTNDVLINSSLELTCYAPENTVATKWRTFNQANFFSLLTFSKEGTCTTDGFLGDFQYFETKCYSNATFKVNIKRVNTSNHGQEWYCSYNFEKSNKPYITVRVPAVDVDIHVNKNVEIRENETLIVSCNTSACRPNPTVKWYLRSSNDTTKYEVTEQSTQSYIPQENGFNSAESKLQFLPNRTVINWSLFCEVWTRSSSSDISSEEIVLNVLYPPEGPPKINGYQNGTKLRVVESESDGLNCSITESNPSSRLSMTCFNSNSTALTFSRTSTARYITWKAMRNYSECTCESEHVIAGKQVTHVTTDFLFPPSKVYFTINGEELKSSTSVVNDNEEVPLVCSTESNPKSDLIIRNERNEQIALMKNTSFVRHTIQNVSCDDAGQYTCFARNILTIRQEAISKLNLITRCPPSPSAVNFIDNKITAVLNFDVTLEFVAHEYFEVLTKTLFSWYKQNSTLQNGGGKYIISSYELKSNLIIRNIETTDFGQYHVLVRNSVGQYIHYYELQEMDQQECLESTLTVTLIAITCTLVLIILVVVLVFICYRYVRRRNNFQPSDNQIEDDVSENQGTTVYDDNYATNDDRKHVYEVPHEQIPTYMEMQSVKTEESRFEYENTKV